jgi:hypothetical protein
VATALAVRLAASSVDHGIIANGTSAPRAGSAGKTEGDQQADQCDHAGQQHRCDGIAEVERPIPSIDG